MLHVSMAAKKTPSKKPVNKSKFVRSLPRTMPGVEVVKKAKEAGIKITIGYVYSIRAKSNATRRKGSTPTAKRGPGRPPKVAIVNGNSRAATRRGGSSGGLEAESERIVERKVSELLKGRLGALFG